MKSEGDALLRIAEEGLRLQGRGEGALRAIRDGGALSTTAAEAGAIASQFVDLRKRLATPRDPGLARVSDLLVAIFNHHTWWLRSANPLRRAGQVVDSFGPSARWLEVVAEALREGRPELTDRLPTPSRVPISD